MIETFIWVPRLEPTGTADYRVLTAKFGDGYEQTASDGINNKSQTWPLTFTGTAAKIGAIRDFLDAHAGSKSFYWTPPLSARGYYKCKSHSIRPLGGGNYELTATFNQSFQP
jgi:phage-related protein